jgi:hypothetical protein
MCDFATPKNKNKNKNKIPENDTKKGSVIMYIETVSKHLPLKKLSTLMI